MSTRSAMNPVVCPAPEALGKLLRDELGPTEIDSVEEHVGACPRCQRILDQLVGSLPDALAPLGRVAEEEPPALPGYAPLGRIDAGGMGVVWRVRDHQLGRDLAVKVMASWGRASPRLIERFLAEARICAQLTHPFIVPVHSMGRLADGRPYYTMKLVEGRTLEALLGRGPAPEERRMQFVQIFDKACQAMAFAHGRGVIHRDLKPGNVMVGAHGEVQLMDWGLAKVLADIGADPRPFEGSESTRGEPEQAECTRTQAGSVLGTAAYMAPEQAQGRVEEVDRQSDVFGLGGILCRILSGEPPYTGPNAEAVRLRAAEADLSETLARLHGCGADPELIQLAERCLASRKADRPADANEVAARLAAYQAGVQERLQKAELERAATRAAAMAERTARRRTRALAVAVLALVALAAGGGLWAQHQASERRAERARQEGALSQEIVAALGNAIRFREAGHFDASRQLLDQARQRLADGGPDDLRAQVEQCLADTALARRLDDARQLTTNAVEEERLDFPGAERGYAAALAEAGLGRGGDDPAGVGARVRASAVRAEVVAALDDWAGVTPDDARRAWLLAVARAADPDPERDRLRRPELWHDLPALMHLIQRPEAAHLPSHLAIALARPLLRERGVAVPLLRAAQAQRPDDYWINVTLARALDQANWPDKALGYYRAALALRPRSVWTHNAIARTLTARSQIEDAIGHYQEAVRLEPGGIGFRFNLGWALARNGQLEAALRQFEEAVRLEPGQATTHYNLAAALSRSGRVEEAIRRYEEALRLDPGFALAHYELGVLLYAQGQREAALRHYEEVIRLAPRHVQVHHRLGDDLRDRGEEKAALRHYEEAVRIDPKLERSHHVLALALTRSGQAEAAIRHYKEALRLSPRNVAAHYFLGLLLADRGQGDEAMLHYTEAIRLYPKHAESHYELGHGLLRQGRFAEALYHLLQGHQLGNKKRGWTYPSAQWVDRAGRLLVWDRKLLSILRGEAQPSDAADRLDLAEVCAIRKRYAAAARFAAGAFAAQPELAEDLQAGHRGGAARAAALAGCGRGQDAAHLSDPEKARLRRQAREWLDADLVLWAKQVTRDRRAAEAALRPWLMDSDLAGVRDPAALAQLPQGERQGWLSLWQQIERLLGEASK